MQQQINLYQPDDASEREPFSAMTMLIIVLISVLLMASLYSMLLWKKEQMINDINKLRAQTEQAKGVVEKLELTVSQLTDQKKEKQQLAHYKKVYASKQQALDELSNMVSGNSAGLSDYFAALARQNRPDVWFRKIAVSSGGSEILLEGQTTDARSLPVLVESLKTEPVFKGVNFRLFKATRDKDKPVLDFIMQTRIEHTDNGQAQ